MTDVRPVAFDPELTPDERRNLSLRCLFHGQKDFTMSTENSNLSCMACLEEICSEGVACAACGVALHAECYDLRGYCVECYCAKPPARMLVPQGLPPRPTRRFNPVRCALSVVALLGLVSLGAVLGSGAWQAEPADDMQSVELAIQQSDPQLSPCN